ncbi:hypothetical protein [Thioalkalivibrio sp. ALJ16]|uniref:hypothetical protein n=1 Tax=Thioalkalivibrio sp. ALJ16 TaxID=1158762 RepID=UPI000376139D|nr:hypothetical protein [Thioalkalivibrio sp. ALJ16]
MPAKTDFKSKLGSLAESQKAIQDEMKGAHDGLMAKIQAKRDELKAITSSGPNVGEILHRAQLSIDEMAGRYEKRLKGAFVESRTAEAMLQTGAAIPDNKNLLGPHGAVLRSRMQENWRKQLVLDLFAPGPGPANQEHQDNQIDGTDTAMLIAWLFRDELVERMRTFAETHAPAGESRAADIERLKAEIADLEEQAAQIRREASEAGLHLEAA